MDKKGIIEQIKSMFSKEEENVELKFVDIEIGEGRILRTPSVEVGQPIVEVIDEVESELEDGTYETSEGLILIVKDNVIDDIKEVEEPVEEGETELEEDKEVEEEEDKFIDARLKDGTMVHVETQNEGVLTVGDLVHVVDKANGVQAPAPEGEHELEDGTVIVLDAESKIVEIIEAEEEVEEEKGEEVDSNVEFQNELFSILNKINKDNEDLRNELSELKSRFNKFSNEPAEEETTTKVTFSKLTKEDKLKHFSKR